MNNFLFFYGGPFSQWYPSNFSINGVQYNTAEQYMMAQKAMLFNDTEMLNAIMATSNPKEQKAFGSQVRGFNADAWNKHCRKVVFDANMQKFLQNPQLYAYLMQTGNLELVEASPTDTIWGIGLAMDDERRHDRSQWRGTNWLGQEIMKVREALRPK